MRSVDGSVDFVIDHQRCVRPGRRLGAGACPSEEDDECSRAAEEDDDAEDKQAALHGMHDTGCSRAAEC
jgi:hypothetical protein